MSLFGSLTDKIAEQVAQGGSDLPNTKYGYIYDPELDFYRGIDEGFFSQDNDAFNSFITDIVEKAKKENAPQQIVDFYSMLEPELQQKTAQLEGNFIRKPGDGGWLRYDDNFFDPNYSGYDIKDFFSEMKNTYSSPQEYLQAYGLDEGFDYNPYIEFLVTKGPQNTSTEELQNFFGELGGMQQGLDLYDYYTYDPQLAQQYMIEQGLFTQDPLQNRFATFLEGLDAGRISGDDYQFLTPDSNDILDAILQQSPDIEYYTSGVGTAIPKEVLDAWKFIDPNVQRGMADWFELLGMDTSYMDPIANLDTYEGRRAAGLTGGTPYSDILNIVGSQNGAQIRAPLVGRSNPTDQNDPFFVNNPDYRWNPNIPDEEGWLRGAWVPKNQPHLQEYTSAYSGWEPFYGPPGMTQAEATNWLKSRLNYVEDDSWYWGGDQRVYDPDIGLGEWRGKYDNDSLLAGVLAMFGDVEGRNWREPGPYWYQGLRDLWNTGQISTNEYLNLQKRNLSNESYIGALDTVRDMLNYGRNQGWSATTTDDFMMMPAEAYDYFFNTLGAIDPEWAGLTLGELSLYENNGYGVKINVNDPVFNDDFTVEDLLAMNFGAPAGWVPDTVNKADAVGSSPLYDSRQRISHGDARDADDYIRDFGLHPEQWTGAAKQTIPLITGEQLEDNTYNWHTGPIFLPFYQGGSSDYDRKTMANQESAGYWRQYGFSTPKAYFDALSKWGIEVQLPENVPYYYKDHGSYKQGSENPNMGWVLPGGITQLKQIADQTVGQQAVNRLDIGSYEDHDGGGFFQNGIGTILGLAMGFFGAPTWITSTMNLINSIGSDNPLGAIAAVMSFPGVGTSVTDWVGEGIGLDMGNLNFLDDDWGGLTFDDLDFNQSLAGIVTKGGLGAIGSAIGDLPLEPILASMGGDLAGLGLDQILPAGTDFLSQFGDKLVTSALLGQDLDLVPLIGQGVSGLVGGSGGKFLGGLVDLALKNMDKEDFYAPITGGGGTGGTGSGTGNSGTQTGGNGSTINKQELALQAVTRAIREGKIKGEQEAQDFYNRLMA